MKNTQSSITLVIPPQISVRAYLASKGVVVRVMPLVPITVVRAPGRQKAHVLIVRNARAQVLRQFRREPGGTTTSREDDPLFLEGAELL